MAIRTLHEGSVIHLKGAAMPMTIIGTATVEFPADSEEAFAGALIGHLPNFHLNVGQLEGEYSQVHGRRIHPELAPPVAPPEPVAIADNSPVSPLDQAIQYALANNWSDALACYEVAKVSMALTDEELIAKGANRKEKTALRRLSNGVDNKGHKIFLASFVSEET